MDVDLLEWANPTVSEFSSDNYTSTITLFDDFLRRSGKFTSLELSGDRDDKDPSVDNDLPSRVRAGSEGKKAILVEEVPNIFMSSTAALNSFRSSIVRYLAAKQVSGPSSRSSADFNKDILIPLIMVISESQLTGTNSVVDSFTAHRLLGPDILNHPNTDTIEFNPIAPTFITKALNLVIEKEALESGRRRVPGPSVLRRLGESGDVRSAIGSLEFLCLKDQDTNDWGGRVASRGKIGPRIASTLTVMEEESLELVTQREANMGLFHAVGKVVYNKRGESGNLPMQPPEHLPQHVRLKLPDVAVDELAEETGPDSQTFVAALHENYVPSCDGLEFLDSLNDCIEVLSDSDILISFRGGKYRGNNPFQGVGTDSLRQDEIAFQVAVRGLLFGLPNPVRRGGLPSSVTGGRSWGKRDAFKMFYPTSMRLGRRMQGVEHLVEGWMMRQRDPMAPSNDGVEDGLRGDEVASWGQRTTSRAIRENDEADSMGACMTPAKDDMVREVLPYMALIERHRPESRSFEELDAVTRVTGEISPITEESLNETDMPAAMTSRTRIPASSKLVQRPNPITPQTANGQPSGSTVAAEQAVSHLYLSDDDIED